MYENDIIPLAFTGNWFGKPGEHFRPNIFKDRDESPLETIAYILTAVSIPPPVSSFLIVV
jgi:hypothetical protein